MRINYNKQVIDYPHGNCGIDSLREYLYTQTSVPVERIKLIFKGTVLKTDEQLLSIDHVKEVITMTGSNADANIVPAITTRIIDDLTTDGKSKMRKKVVDKNIVFQPSKYGFQRIATLPNLPDESRAREILSDLAMDEGVLAVCNKYKWTIGTLGELFPDRSSPTLLLGLNTNQGEKIELRLRDDDLQGFCKRYSLLEVLCHELAHNVHGPHDDKFYQLMRQLQKEVMELNWKKNTARTTGGNVAGKSYLNDYELNDDYEDTKVYILEGDVSRKNSMPASKASGIFAISRSQREIEIENNCSVCSSIKMDDGMYCLPSNQEKIPSKEINTEDITTTSDELAPVSVLSINSESSLLPSSDVKSETNTHESAMLIDAEEATILDPTVALNTITRDDLTTALIANIVDEAISMSVGMDADSPVDRLQICRTGMYNIINTNNASIALLIEVFEFLCLLINNALTLGSSDTRYRRVKITNGKFNRLVVQVNGSLEVLRSVGFNDDKQGNVSLDRYDSALLYLMSSLVESCLLDLSKYREYRIE